jgi:putative intracellular protease/amidase
MRYYIATKLERHADHNLVRDLMAARGHEITYDWTKHGPVWSRGSDVIREVAQLETRGVLDADLVIVLLPGGRGTHAELGMAIAAGKPVLMHCADPDLFGATPETCAFYHHPLCFASGGSLDRLALLAESRLELELNRRWTP